MDSPAPVPTVNDITVGLVVGLIGAGLSQRAALSLAGMARSSWHYRSSPRPRVADPVPHTQRRAVLWLTAIEQDAITVKVKTAFAQGLSVYQAFYEALDAGDPVASLSSWYRLARERLEPARPVRRRARHRSSAIPVLVATARLEVWSWDITKLKGPYRGVCFEMYVVIDVFSRMIVAWRIEEHEDQELAREMFETAFATHKARPTVVHSDGGPSMTSNTVTGFLRNLGVEISRNRPRVSNDNPYSESLFKTAKYVPTYPKHFDTIEQARDWATEFVRWYNHDHRHTGLEGHTPASVHDGSWVEVHRQRTHAMHRLHAAHPERFKNKPVVKTPMAQVAINYPTNTDRLQTG
ncbi:MAG: IS3 family transposase [Candidatus Nanopelagicales bacterium]